MNDGAVSSSDLIAESREIWDANADAWDAKIGAGGGWQSTVIAPVAEQLLGIEPGESVFEVACGNGLFARRLAELGAFVVASDFSGRMIEHARQRTTSHTDRIEYHMADATDN